MRGACTARARHRGGIDSPPEYQRPPALIGDLVSWLREDTDDDLLTRAGLTHLDVVSIHPWVNGNGRTACVAGSLMLMRCGIGSPEHDLSSGG